MGNETKHALFHCLFQCNNGCHSIGHGPVILWDPKSQDFGTISVRTGMLDEQFGRGVIEFLTFLCRVSAIFFRAIGSVLEPVNLIILSNLYFQVRSHAIFVRVNPGSSMRCWLRGISFT